MLTRLSSLLVLGALLGLGAAQVAQGANDASGSGTPAATQVKPDITFIHTLGKSKIFTLELRDGQRFTVRIDETCPDAFDYAYVGVERGEQTVAQSKALGAKPLEPKDLEVTHDKRFGGYVFNISAKAGIKPADICTGGEKLAPASFIVSVSESDWNVAVSGGFTISSLTNPVFGLKTEKGGKTIVEEPDKQDERRLGAASFVHLFHDRIAWHGIQPALAFGLGINSDNHAEYLVGGALRLGGKATINFGRTWGSVSRLPNGVSTTSPVTDDNVLNNLGARTVSRWFFALSYSFIDTKDRLLKPFAEASAPASTGGGSGSTDRSGASIPDAKKKPIVDAAKNTETYSKIDALKKLFPPQGNASLCGADVTAAGPDVDKKTPVKVTLRLKGADAELASLTTAGHQAAEAIAKALPDGWPVSLKDPVTFAKCE